MSVRQKRSRDENPGLDAAPLPLDMDQATQARLESLISSLKNQPYHSTIDDSPIQNWFEQINSILIGDYYDNFYMIHLNYFKYKIPKNASILLKDDMELKHAMMANKNSIAIQNAKDSNPILQIRILENEINTLMHAIHEKEHWLNFDKNRLENARREFGMQHSGFSEQYWSNIEREILRLQRDIESKQYLVDSDRHNLYLKQQQLHNLQTNPRIPR